MTDLHLYFNQQDYENLAGPAWPAYKRFLQGEKHRFLKYKRK